MSSLKRRERLNEQEIRYIELYMSRHNINSRLSVLLFGLLLLFFFFRCRFSLSFSLFRWCMKLWKMYGTFPLFRKSCTFTVISLCIVELELSLTFAYVWARRANDIECQMSMKENQKKATTKMIERPTFKCKEIERIRDNKYIIYTTSLCSRVCLMFVIEHSNHLPAKQNSAWKQKKINNENELKHISAGESERETNCCVFLRAFICDCIEKWTAKISNN